MLTTVPDAIAMTRAGVPAHKLTLTGSIWLAGDIFAPTRFQPHAGAIRVPDKSLLNLLMFGMDPIGEGREAEHVVRDGIVNGRVSFDGVLEPRGPVWGALRRSWRLQGSPGRLVVSGTWVCSPAALALVSAEYVKFTGVI